MRYEEGDIYAPCPCGSGRKYKFCCREKHRQTARHTATVSGFGRDVVVLDVEEGRRLNEQGMQLMTRLRFERAERCFREAVAAAPMIPSSHNNLAYAVFNQGRLEEAIQIQEYVLQDISPGNVFGMSSLVHYYLIAGRRAEAEALANEVQRLDALDFWTLAKQCETLARLGHHREILKLVERYSGDPSEDYYYYAGVAAANVGRLDRALEYLQRIGRKHPLWERAAKLVGLMKSGQGPDTVDGRWPYFMPDEVMPRPLFEKLLRDAKEGGEALARFTMNESIVDVFAAFLNARPGEEHERKIVEALGSLEHPRAVELLKQIAEGTFGSDESRLEATRKLVDKKVWDKSPRQLWIKGEWITVQSRQFDVTPEATSAPVPDDLIPLCDAATSAVRRGRWKKGETLWREFLAKAPSFHPGYHNLAVALIQQGRDGEAETCLRKALELAPDYIFAHCTLAMLFLRRNRLAEARALLDKLALPDKIHPAALVTYSSAQGQLAIEEGDREKAVGWLEMASKVDRKSPLVKELKRRCGLLGRS